MTADICGNSGELPFRTSCSVKTLKKAETGNLIEALGATAIEVAKLVINGPAGKPSHFELIFDPTDTDKLTTTEARLL